jgi:WD40 repeat protein/uncharacterized protein YecT (DUF1311 family)
MKKHILFLSCLFLLLFSSVCHGTNEASFDCEKASTPTEKCICSDDDLSRTDGWLASEYLTRLKFLSPEEKNNLKSEQIAWLKKRDKACEQAEGSSSNTYGVDKGCLKKMYEERVKELYTKIQGLLRLDLNLPHDLQLLISEKFDKYSIRPSYYFRLSDHEYLLYGYGISYADSKKGSVDSIIWGNMGATIHGAIRGKGITWLIVHSGNLHQGHERSGYQAIMITDKKSSNEPYQLFDLASDSTLDYLMGNSNPCPYLEDADKDIGWFSELKGYDVKDLNGDGINDMVFHIEAFDCEANKRISIEETYYFLPRKPFIEKKEKKSYAQLPAFSPRVGHSWDVTSVAFSPDGRYVLSGSLDNTLKLWNVATGEEIRTFKGHSISVESVAFSPDGRYALSGSGDNTLKLWDVATGEEIRTFTGHTGPVESVAFSPDGRYALSGGAIFDQTIKLWEVATGKEIRTFKGHSDMVESVTFSPDGRYALSGSFDGTLKLWDVATGKEIRTFIGHQERVKSVTFSPDGRYILSAGYDKILRFWNVATGKEIKTFERYSYIISSIAFSPDGRYALSGSWDGAVGLWDVTAGKEIKTFKGHSETVESVAFSPDGRYALSGSDDKTMKLWDVVTGKEIRTFGHSPYIKSVSKISNEKTVKNNRDILQAAEADVNAKDKDGNTALMSASRNGNIAEVRKLLAAKADVNATDNKGNTALMLASRTFYVEIVRELLAAKADVNARNKDGATALMLASGYSHPGLVVTDKNGKMVVINKSLVGNVEVVRALLAAKADVNVKSNKNGRTALMAASLFGTVEVVRELLAARADVNAKSNDGGTALMEASRYGNVEVVRELLAAKADVNAKNNDGRTALMEASKGHDDVVKLLKEAGAIE